jgi:hypothetical protein
MSYVEITEVLEAENTKGQKVLSLWIGFWKGKV